MCSYIVNVVTAVVVSLAGFGHVTRAADCVVANFAVQPNFNISAYAGRWYELNYLPPYFETGYDAWMDYYEQYTLDNSTGTPQLNFTGAGRDAGNNFQCVGGNKNPLKVWNLTTSPAKLYFYTNNINLDHWVIGTDYVTYAVIYGCPILNTNGTCQKPTAKVNSRTRNITDAAVLNTVNSLLNSVCLDTTMLNHVWQNATLCPETTTAAPQTTTATATGTELMASLPALLLTMLLAVVNHQCHATI